MFINDETPNTGGAQDDATGVNNQILTQNGAVQDDATGVDNQILTQNGTAQDDATGVNNQVLTQNGFVQDDATGVDNRVLTQNGLAQDDATGVDNQVLTQNGFVQDDATGVDNQVLTQNGFVQDDATGVDNQVLTQNGAVQDDATGVDDQVASQFEKGGYAQDDATGVDRAVLANKNASFDGEEAVDLSDPSAQRLKIANLRKGGGRADKPTDAAVTINDKTGGVIPHDKDWRVRITLSDAAKVLYKSQDAQYGLLKPITDGGVIFPYTPDISITHVSNWESQKLTHSNYNSFFYTNSEVQAISISADFTIQNQEEGRYVLAVLYFFRSVTKMFFGQDAAYAGNPPPIVYLDGYGTHYLPHVPCVVTNFKHSMPGDTDYIAVKSYRYITSGEDNRRQLLQEETRLPLVSKVEVTLQPIYSRNNVYKNFSLDAFSRGELIKGKGGFL